MEALLQTHHATHLGGTEAEVLTQIREAALLALKLYGTDQPNDDVVIRCAFFAGMLVAYYRCKPGKLGRRSRGCWNTSEGKQPDPYQHVIDIRTGEQVAGIGWRGDGPIRHDVLIRGPWEFELLKAVGLSVPLPPGTIRPVPAFPESKSRWKLDGILDHSLVATRLSQPVTLTVIGYHSCRTAVAATGDGFLDVRELLTNCYELSRGADGETSPATGQTSCFVLEGRIGDRFRRRGPPAGRPDFSYFIGSDDGLSVATSLALAFDRDNSGRGPSSRLPDVSSSLAA